MTGAVIYRPWQGNVATGVIMPADATPFEVTRGLTVSQRYDIAEPSTAWRFDRWLQIPAGGRLTVPASAVNPWNETCERSAGEGTVIEGINQTAEDLYGAHRADGIRLPPPARRPPG